MKAIIAGAGIAGLSSAHALHRAGWEVTVVERARALRAGGYMIDFFGPGYDAAEALGILPALRARAHKVDEVLFVDETGRTRSKIDYRLATGAAKGKLFPILRGDVERALFDALPDGVDLRYGLSATGCESAAEGVGVTLSDGTMLEADLAVGADGIHSEVRRAVFGPEADFVRYLGYHTAAYFFRAPRVAAALAGKFTLMTVPNRLLGLYEVGDGLLASFFVYRAESARRPDDPVAALRRTFGDLGWLVPETLAAAPGAGEVYYDVVAQTVMPNWSSGRVVLVGDAAYAVSLLAGQGASLAIAGGNALGEALAGRPVPDALAAFDARLRPPVLEKQRAGRRTANWFVPPTAAHLAVRDVVLNVVNSPLLVGLLGRFFSFGSKGFALAER